VSLRRFFAFAWVVPVSLAACGGDAFEAAPADASTSDVGADVSENDATGSLDVSDSGRVHDDDATTMPPVHDASIDAPSLARDAEPPVDGAGGGADATPVCNCTACSSCSLPGHGACTHLPDGVDDTVTFCEGQATCSQGQCTSAGSKGHYGDSCMSNGDCFNGMCAEGTCKLANGDACADDAACANGLCSGKSSTCAACTAGMDCASGKCSGGVCALPGGAVCDAGTDCASGSCSAAKRCTPTGTCTVATCITHFCGSTAQCQTCSTANDCPMGTPCTGGTCLAPSGAYCTANAECASGTCLAAPLVGVRKCQ
jgi:hypothetical protein